jgi:hypothetical protein
MGEKRRKRGAQTANYSRLKMALEMAFGDVLEGRTDF